MWMFSQFKDAEWLPRGAVAQGKDKKRKSTGQQRDRQDALITSVWEKTQNHRKLDRKNNKDSETTGYSGSGKVTFTERLGLKYGTEQKARRLRGFPGQHAQKPTAKMAPKRSVTATFSPLLCIFQLADLKKPAVSGSPFFFPSRSVHPGKLEVKQGIWWPRCSPASSGLFARPCPRPSAADMWSDEMPRTFKKKHIYKKAQTVAATLMRPCVARNTLLYHLLYKYTAFFFS